MKATQTLTPKFFEESISTLDEKFRNKFLEQHKRLKGQIHLCQHLAYKKETLTLEQSEQSARSCFLPLLLVRRHAQTMLLNSKDEFKKCMEKADLLKDAPKGYDGARFTCLSEYKNDLKRSV